MPIPATLDPAAPAAAADALLCSDELAAVGRTLPLPLALALAVSAGIPAPPDDADGGATSDSVVGVRLNGGDVFESGDLCGNGRSGPAHTHTHG